MTIVVADLTSVAVVLQTSEGDIPLTLIAAYCILSGDRNAPLSPRTEGPVPNA